MNCEVRRVLQAVAGALFMLFLSGVASGAGNPKRGAQVFQACMACHSVKAGEHMTGPSLARVWNRKAGTAEGFLRYSDALKRADIIWNEATLDKWLVSPEQFVAGTSMTFPGVRESRDRQDVIAYLRSVSEGKAPSAEPRRGGMMMQSWVGSCQGSSGRASRPGTRSDASTCGTSVNSSSAKGAGPAIGSASR